MSCPRWMFFDDKEAAAIELGDKWEEMIYMGKVVTAHRKTRDYSVQWDIDGDIEKFKSKEEHLTSIRVEMVSAAVTADPLQPQKDNAPKGKQKAASNSGAGSSGKWPYL